MNNSIGSLSTLIGKSTGPVCLFLFLFFLLYNVAIVLGQLAVAVALFFLTLDSKRVISITCYIIALKRLVSSNIRWVNTYTMLYLHYFLKIHFSSLFICHGRVSFADPVAVRHSLEILSDLAMMDPYAVAMALGNLLKLLFLWILISILVLPLHGNYSHLSYPFSYYILCS